jgi:hypothetical protein
VRAAALVATVLVLGAAAAAPALAAAPARAGSQGRIVYVCGQDLCQVDPATKATKRLTRNGASGQPYRLPSLSRDGSQLVFTRGTDVFRARGDASNARKVQSSLPAALEMSPSGGQLAYLTTILEPVLCLPPRLPGSCGSVDVTLLLRQRGAGEGIVTRRNTFSFGWANEDLLATLDAEPDAGVPGQRICRVADDGSCREVRGADGLRDLYDPEGSPDGRQILATASPLRTDDEQAAFRGHIALFRASDGTFVRDLTAGADADATWSPDGKRVAFERAGAIFVVDVKTGAKRKLVRGTHPAWGRR